MLKLASVMNGCMYNIKMVDESHIECIGGMVVQKPLASGSV